MRAAITRSSAAGAYRGLVNADAPEIEVVKLSNGGTLSARVLTLGAALQAIDVADRNGVVDDIVLGHDDIFQYLEDRHFFGATVGRYANRIAKGRFLLDGHERVLSCNDGPHHLHGGHHGFDRRVWTIGDMREGEAASVSLHLVSADGDEGYSGTLRATVTYTLDHDSLTVDYRATTDAPTIVNLTNHSFFNLAGSRSTRDVLEHRLTVYGTHVLPVDATLIPTGDIASVVGTPFDFRAPVAIGARIRDGDDEQLRIGRGYDHNFLIDGPADTLRHSARLEDPVSGRVLDIAQTAPGLQLYSGNFLDGSVVGKRGRLYRQGDGVVLEPQLFPDSPNYPGFPSARLDPGKTYANTFVYRFSILTD